MRVYTSCNVDSDRVKYGSVKDLSGLTTVFTQRHLNKWIVGWLVSSLSGLFLTKQENMLHVCTETDESKRVKPLSFPIMRVFSALLLPVVHGKVGQQLPPLQPRQLGCCYQLAGCHQLQAE